MDFTTFFKKLFELQDEQRKLIMTPEGIVFTVVIIVICFAIGFIVNKIIK